MASVRYIDSFRIMYIFLETKTERTSSLNEEDKDILFQSGNASICNLNQWSV